MLAKNLYGSLERHRGVLVAQAQKGLDVNVFTMAADLKVARSLETCFGQWSGVVKVQGSGARAVAGRELRGDGVLGCLSLAGGHGMVPPLGTEGIRV